LYEAVEKYYLTPERIINLDEKGFMIGYARTTKRIVLKEAYKQGQLLGAQHNGNREWITLLAAIVAIGKKLSLALIYKGESYDL